MRIWSLALWVSIASSSIACGEDASVDPVADAATLDAGLLAYEPSNLSEMDLSQNAGVLVVPEGETRVLNTDDLTVEMLPMGVGAPRVQTQTDDSQIAVFRYESIQIDGTLEVVGSRMLALVSGANASVAGAIVFPNGAALTCGLVTTGVLAGGGGGGFGSVGGQGGNAGGAPGATRGNDTLVPLLPGCSGGPGIGPATADGGFAGAALQIAAAGAVSVAGTLCVSGGGGESVTASGGGGGGSGGAILIEGREIVFSSSAGLIASGGAGGGGGSASAPGGAGETVCTEGAALAGAGGGALAGAGGAGGAGAGPGMNGTSGINANLDAGGGAGGGVGRIRMNSASGAAATDVGVFSGTVTQGVLGPAN